MTTSDHLSAARRTLQLEIEALQEILGHLDQTFSEACELMLKCQGRIVVTGMGKSGHIGNKIAATLASTGTPAFFMHPGEASHGDLGMVTRNDLVLALSNSGETQEVTSLLPLLKRLGIPVVSMTGAPASTLAREATLHLNVAVSREACPLNLAPTSSTTAALALGDALAIALLEARGFGPDDFAMSHPGGSLGRRLLLRVSDIMHAGDTIPCVTPATSLREALLEMTRKGLGFTCIADEQKQLLGVYTDGDLRRTLDQAIDFHSLSVSDVMTRGCKSIQPDLLAAEAVHLMEENKINALPVTDSDNRLVGALNMHDLLRAGVI
ncbi:KpsF/GutQ family sugar-phosphate isomerase [Marinospirillum alkaliphilum]|uniref:Arabinose 5-phosphate isomerase n=1 Tax=Marinospirillum alkaliphilum DSM 21637 TaxID=1122209 RepID=A0A1K1TNB1_9GAMM|nr:KpsF/GutQ family sugar-phosphate isomerase [Marinospirillum alkaliphilum]SFX02231.1 arabinose-5-phosphate isomerase [Marinospirillum alkaliphilum DSM 21637]